MIRRGVDGTLVSLVHVSPLMLEDEEAMRAAEAEVVGGDLNATQSLREMRLDGPKASSVKAAENYQDQPEKESNEHD